MKPFLFFLFTFSFFSQTQLLSLVSSATTTIPHQLITLLSIKSSLIDPLNHLNDWKNTSSNSNNIWCSWRGISCHPKTTQITSLNLSNLNLTGIISLKIRHLTTLTHLDISGNDFNGCFQAAIFQLTELVTLDISHNSFNSTFPKGISKLRFLRIFNAYSNNFIGPLPEELTGFPFLEKLNLGESYFNGTIPASYGNFERLKFLYLAGNALEGSVPPELGLLSELQHLEIGYNKFSGTLPVELTMLSNLKYLDISSSNISGQVIPELGNLTMLEKLYISKNRLSGEIPSNIGQLESLQHLDLSDNELTGSIPSEITMLKELRWMNLMLNKLKGEIPQGIGELPKLNTFQVFNNSLIGRLPPKLGSNGLLQRIDVSTNLIQGSIPINICKGNNLVKLILFDNNFTNTLPSSLNNCTSLTRARIQNNKLNGPIPQTLTMLPKLTFLDLSNNNFNGKIPQKLGNLRYLNGLWEFTAFQQLNFTVDDLFERMETADIIGKGSTGTVHKAVMPGGEIIAVKVILTKQDTVSTIKRRGVLAEVGVLGGNVRHRNIVRLLGCCSNKEKTMLLYNYMENGNLDEFLHAENNGDNMVNVSDWVTRYKIALGVAHGISYLHHDCNPVVVHRDIKPSNILLDGQMEAKVADFGIAKLIQIDELESTIIGTHGYIAPENAERLQVDEKTDIYSYGVVLMELISGKRALNEEFGEGKNIVDWVDSKLKTEDGIDGILDKNAGADRDSVKKEMTNMLRIALLCTSRHRANRPSMRDVLSMLQKRKYQPRRELNDIDIYNFDVGEGSGDGQT